MFERSPWTPPRGQQLPSVLVTALAAGRDGTLWIGTSQGLVSWNAGRLTHHTALSNMHITALLEDRSGTIWAGHHRDRPGEALRVSNGKREVFRRGWNAWRVRVVTG